MSKTVSNTIRESKKKSISQIASIGRKYKVLRYPILLFLVLFIFTYNFTFYFCKYFKMKERMAKAIAMAMCVILCVTSIDLTAFAFTGEANPDKNIVGISSLSDEIANQKVNHDATLEDIEFPESLNVHVIYQVEKEIEVEVEEEEKTTPTPMPTSSAESTPTVEPTPSAESTPSAEPTPSAEVEPTEEPQGEDVIVLEEINEEDNQESVVTEQEAPTEEPTEESPQSDDTQNDATSNENAESQPNEEQVSKLSNDEYDCLETVYYLMEYYAEEPSEEEVVVETLEKSDLPDESADEETEPETKIETMIEVIEEDVSVPVEWSIDEEKSSKTEFVDLVAGEEYIFVPAITEEGYSLNDEVELPVIKVTVEESKAAFEKSVTVDGVVITVTADEGVFPEDATIEARKVTASEEKEVEEAIDEVRDEEKNVAVSYTFDITIYDKDGNEIEPDTSKGSVKVTFKMAEIANENLETEVYHVEETDDGLNVENLDVNTDKGEKDEAAVETDSFSYYTVEFTYGNLQYVMEGDTQVTLKEILDYLGIVGEVKDAIFSSPELVDVSKNESDEWIVTALQPFSSDEKLFVTIGGIDFDIDFEIAVTDDFYIKGIKSFIAELNQRGELNKYVVTGTYYEKGTNTPRRMCLFFVPEKNEGIVCDTDYRIKGNGGAIYPIYRYPGKTNPRPFSVTGVVNEEYDGSDVSGILSNAYDIIATGTKDIALDIEGFYNGAFLDTSKSYAVFVMNLMDWQGYDTFYNVCGKEDAHVSMGALLPISLKLYKEDPNNLGHYTTIAETTTHFVENTTISYDSWPVESMCGKGYHFSATTSSGAGVCTAQSGEKQYSNRKGPDVVIYYDLDRFTVSFNANGGTGAPASIENVAYGTKVTEPSTIPTRDGYSFGGWYKEAACTNAWNFETDTVTSATTLYAKWSYKVASVTHNSTVTYYDSLQKAINAASSGDTVQLLADTTENVTVGENIKLDLNGKVLKGTGSGSVVTINGNVTLTLDDSDKSAPHASLPAGGVITGGNNTSHGGGVLILGGTFIMNAGTISGNSASDSGSGICVGKSSSSYNTPSEFIMNGGTISGNTGSSWGGGVCVGSGNNSSSTFTMNNGTISGNSSADGGGVHVGGNGSFNTFNMCGGTISNNISSGSGGGVSVYLYSGATKYNFVITGGKITNNTASVNGGGVNIRPNMGTGQLTIGGTAQITDNNKGSIAQNVYIGSGKTFSLGTGDKSPKSGMSVGVTTEDTPTVNTPVPITGDNGADYSIYFESDNSAYAVKNVNNVLKLMKAGKITNKAPATDKEINHGYITIDKSSALAGETVEVTGVIPNARYSLKSLKYNDTSIEKDTLGKYIFIMPNEDVEVTAEFVEHEHNFTYTASDNVLKAACLAGCPDSFDTTPLKLTLSAPADLVYNGSAKEASIGDSEKSAWVTAGLEVPGIAYTAKTGSELSDSKPKKVGDYSADITAGSVTATVDFTITKALSEIITAPSANSLTYDGDAQTLVSVGTSAGGTMNYAAGNSSTTAPASGWNTSVPIGKKAGTYYVWYKCVGDSDHSDTDPVCVTVTVAQKSITVSGITAINRGYVKDDKSVTLVTTGATLNGVVDGDELSATATGEMADANAGENKSVTIENLTLTGADKGNYKLATSGQQTSTTVTISKASHTVTAPTALNPTYNGSEQSLISEGSCSTGTIKYSLDGTNYYDSLDSIKKKEAGSYTVHYMVEGDANYETYGPETITAKIVKKAEPTPAPKPDPQPVPSPEPDDPVVTPTAPPQGKYAETGLTIKRYVSTAGITAGIDSALSINDNQIPLPYVTSDAGKAGWTSIDRALKSYEQTKESKTEPFSVTMNGYATVDNQLLSDVNTQKIDLALNLDNDVVVVVPKENAIISDAIKEWNSVNEVKTSTPTLTSKAQALATQALAVQAPALAKAVQSQQHNLADDVYFRVSAITTNDAKSNRMTYAGLDVQDIQAIGGDANTPVVKVMTSNKSVGAFKNQMIQITFDTTKMTVKYKPGDTVYLYNGSAKAGVGCYTVGTVDKDGKVSFWVPMVSSYWTIGNKNLGSKIMKRG